ncbi:hypothetical protein QCD61_07510 [Pseudomonas viciae]|uniref:Uncharacterized protein n=1 Tax=Pseudomonas viciae TaxID=2505979 RepID=A0ABY8PI85_9PSED|nr:hypothetical protein [Pseudomonas viciae]WGO94921.1 hypothetical protein QCD61_07510 [Pseudomonas viciae]
MTRIKPVVRYLESLSASGYGAYISFASDPVLGQGVYEIVLEGCVLRLFEKGLTISFKGEIVDVFYFDILDIASHLSAEVFSKASESQNVDVKVPLEIYVSERVVALEVQLLAYSRVVNVLNYLWGGLKE